MTLDEAFGEMHRHIADLHARHADLEARIERMLRKGKVTDVDMEKHLYRQEIGLDDQGQSVKSPWLPYSQQAGGRKGHSPPTVGEQFLLVNPDGSPDFTQAVGVPHGWYDKNPSPSKDPAADVYTRANTTDTTKQDLRKLEVGSSSIEITGDTITITASNIKINGQTDINQ